MQHKLINLTLAFVVLLSMQGFSQATEKSNHPLLDKYYPENRDKNNAPAPEVKPAAQPIPTPVATTTSKPAVLSRPVTKPIMAPAAITATAPALVATPALPPTTITTEALTPSLAAPAMTATTTIDKPTIITPQASPTQKIATSLPTSIYNGTRLGSSTKQYDTWEKNNNGAGSVTTSSK